MTDKIELINSMGRYTQKSNTFLYPLLNLPIKPIETYLKFGNIDLGKNRLLIGLYWTEDEEYKKYKTVLEESKYYDYTFIDNVFAIITFNMYSVKNEYDLIIKGNYSKVSENCKSVIAERTTNEAVMKCLYPKYNYEEFAAALGVQSELLEGKELLSPPQDSAEVLNVTEAIKKEIEEYYN